MHILITGGTGFIGRHLVNTFTAAGHTVTILTRGNRTSNQTGLIYQQWDGTEIPATDQPYDTIINLAGTSIAGPRWTDARKKSILDSRQKATQACVSYINSTPNPPKVFLSATAVGYYGSDSTAIHSESSPAGADFPAQVCGAWEQAAAGANCRTVLLRIGIVLGKDGGALQQMLPIYKTYLGGRFGSGKQGFPWIHIEDIVGIIQHSIQQPAVSGPINLVAPETVDQATFSSVLAKSLGRIDPFAVPEFVLKLAMGEQSVLFIGGQKASPAKIQESGYVFRHPQLAEALSTFS